MTAFFESLSFEGFEITDSPRIKRLHSDRAGEFTAPYFQRFLSNHRSIYHTLTSGYGPQAKGTAERSVGLQHLALDVSPLQDYLRNSGATQ